MSTASLRQSNASPGPAGRRPTLTRNQKPTWLVPVIALVVLVALRPTRAMLRAFLAAHPLD